MSSCLRVRLFRFLATLAACAAISAAHAADLHVRDFGALPDDGQDDMAAIQKAIEAAKPGDTIRFDAGVYWFTGEGVNHYEPTAGSKMFMFPEDYAKGNYATGQKACIDITRKRGITLLGAIDADEKPATVLMRLNPCQPGVRPPSQILVLHSEDIAIKNFKITMDQRFTVVYEVVEANPDHIIAHVDEAYPLGEGLEVRGFIRPSVTFDAAGKMPGQPKGKWEVVDREKRLMRIDYEPGKGSQKIEGAGVQPGDLLYASFSIADGPTQISGADSRNLTIENVWINTGSHRGSHYHQVRDLTVKGLYISVEGDLIGATARGGTTMVTPLGHTVMDRFYVYTCGDDAQPSYMMDQVVLKKPDARTVIYGMAAYSCLYLHKLPAEVWRYGRESGDPEFVANCIEMTPLDGRPDLGRTPNMTKFGVMKFDRDLPEDLVPLDFGNQPTTWSSLWFKDLRAESALYRNSSFEYTHGQIRFEYQNAVIDNITLLHSAISKMISSTFPGENGLPRNITTRNSQFLHSPVLLHTENPSRVAEMVRLLNNNFIENFFLDTAPRTTRETSGIWCESVVENNLYQNPPKDADWSDGERPPTVVWRNNRPAKMLLHENFIRNRWLNVEHEWKSVTGAWSIDDECHRFYKQTDESDTPKLSTVGEAAWDNYSVKVLTRRIADQGTLGVIGRYADADNYTLFEQDASNVRLIKVVAGKRTTLAEAPFSPQPGEWFALQLTLSGDKLSGQVDSKTLVEATDPKPAPGRVGLYSQGGRAKFDDLIALQPQ